MARGFFLTMRVNIKQSFRSMAFITRVSKLPQDSCSNEEVTKNKILHQSCNIQSISQWEKSIEKAQHSLQSGGVIAVPTDTIYGLACLAQDDQAVKKLYEIKQRDPQKPVAICVPSIDRIYEFARVTVSNKLLQELLPGPVTLVFERTPALNPLLNPCTQLIGVRIPNYKHLLQITKHCNPLALTSANFSAKESSSSIEEFKQLWPQLELVLDGGKLGNVDPLKQGSTVIDLSKNGFYQIIRAGCARSRVENLLLNFGLKKV